MKTVYKDLVLFYEYTTYSWIVTTKTGETIGFFSNMDKAKSFIDSITDAS
jgi:hypothetical protein